jgi:hypothetical protein
MPLSAGSDVYFSADVETDGPIPGPYSMLSFGLVLAGSFDGERFSRPQRHKGFYRELRPISERYDEETLAVSGLDRPALVEGGTLPRSAMNEAAAWIRQHAGAGRPVLVAQPVAFDWTWLYWYFVNFADGGSPFGHSSCFDVKTAYAVKARLPIAQAGRSTMPVELRSQGTHTHVSLEDAAEQAETFIRVFLWKGE